MLRILTGDLSTCPADTTSFHLDENIIFTEFWQWHRDNRELLRLGVPEELGQPGISSYEVL